MQYAGRLSISPSTCLWDRVIVVFVQENVFDEYVYTWKE